MVAVAIMSDEGTKRTRLDTPFDEARRAQAKLEALELKRRAIIDALSDEAAAMLEALEELRAKQSIDVAPSAPSVDIETE